VSSKVFSKISLAAAEEEVNGGFWIVYLETVVSKK
jgi:hypothetical protein